MKRMTRNLILLAALGGLTQLAACAAQRPYGQPVYGQQQTVGYPAYGAQPGCASGILGDPNVDAIIGGGLGGLLGNQFGSGQGNSAMTALGAVAGVVAGRKLGQAAGPC